MIKRTDGIHEEFRPQQNQFLDWLEKNLPLNTKLGGELKTGVGKTAIIRAIQSSFLSGTVDVVSYSNQLVDEYAELYGCNSLKGVAHYDTSRDYKAARKAALNKPTIYNPYSWIYFNSQIGRCPDIIVFDEAHRLLSTLEDFSSIEIPLYSVQDKQQLKNKKPNDFEVLNILSREINSLKKSDSLESLARRTRLQVLKNDLLEHPEVYSVKIESKIWKSRRKYFLNITPVKTPIHLIDTLFPAKKHIYLSATMPEFVFKALSRKGAYMALPHPVPIENRKIISYPIAEDSRTDLQALGLLINTIIRKEGNPNTLVHTTYADTKHYIPFLDRAPITYHCASQKNDATRLYKESGGTLLASGMAEGVSFPDDECRLIIIPKLPYPSMGDTHIRKKMACLYGPLWYKLTTMLTFWQMVGRACRHKNDYCKVFVLDPTFGSLYNETKAFFDNSLNSTIIWDHNRSVR